RPARPAGRRLLSDLERGAKADRQGQSRAEGVTGEAGEAAEGNAAVPGRAPESPPGDQEDHRPGPEGGGEDPEVSEGLRAPQEADRGAEQALPGAAQVRAAVPL